MVKKVTIIKITHQSSKKKTAELLTVLHDEKPNVVIGTETWFNSSILDAELFPSEYTIFSKDRPDGYGGFLIAMKNLSCHLVDSLDTNSECMWDCIECSPKKMYVGAFYNQDS